MDDAQTVADSDQNASDADQSASEADEAQARSDQAASDRDQAAADRDFASVISTPTVDRTHEITRGYRERGTAERGAAHMVRSQITRQRLETATVRDDHADRRDAEAAERDKIAENLDGEAGDERVEEARARAAADRRRAAEDRQRAAEDRRRAAADREAADAELELAFIDHLTGAYRRGVGEAALRNEMIRAKRTDTSLVLAFVDVNGLKAVNDYQGHAAGDALLHEVATAIRMRLRPYDPLVRVGGDEFVCAIAGVDTDGARARFDEVEQALASGSISIGLARMRPEDSLEDLMARSDAALREARGL